MNTKLKHTTIGFAVAVALGALAMGACSNGTRTISTVSSEEQWSGTGNLDSPAAAERHGCCVGNGGACGCAKGKVQCCDGSASSACSCL